MTLGQFLALPEAAQRERTRQLLTQWELAAQHEMDADYAADVEGEARDGWSCGEGRPL